MLRLGDAYAALAVTPNLSRHEVFAAQKLADPVCDKCGKRMRLVRLALEPDEAPSAQGFRCSTCGQTRQLEIPSLRDRPASSSVEQHHVAVSFRRYKRAFAPGPAVECPDAEMAIQRAELMLRQRDIVGAVAFSRGIDPVTGEFRQAVILRTFGEVPKGFDIA
jgi:hypothetical protein